MHLFYLILLLSAPRPGHPALSLLDPSNFLSTFQQAFHNLTVDTTHLTTNPPRNDSNITNQTNLNIRPPGQGPMPPATTTSPPIFIITKNTGPQSFSLLMNFQCDGTSLVQILKENSFYWADNGRCSHGRVYDPATGRCRDVFCATGYTLTSQGCTKEAINSTKLEQVKKRDEIRVDLSLAHDLCLYEIDVNETEVCGHSLLSNDLSVFIDEFRDGLSQIMDVDAARFGEIRVKSRLLVNEKPSANYTLTNAALKPVLG